MKSKNASFVDRYIEKIVLAVGILFFLVVGWFYFVGNPYEVTIDRQVVQPDQVERRLQERARLLEQKITSTDNPLPALQIPDYVEDFRRRATRPSLNVAQFPVPLAELGLDQNLIHKPSTAHLLFYHVPEPPPPADPIIRAGYAVLAEPESQADAEFYTRLIGEQMPRDFRWVTVAATFNFEHWQQRIRQRPPSSDYQAMPEEWWRTRMFITHVSMERQKLDLLTHEWGEVEQVPILPGYVSDFAPTQRRYTQSEARDLLDRVQLEQDMLSRPAFVSLAQGRWLPPGDAAQAYHVVDHEQRIEELRQRVSQLEQEMAALQEPATPPAGRANPQADRQRRTNLERLTQQLEQHQQELTELREAQQQAAAQAERQQPTSPFAPASRSSQPAASLEQEIRQEVTVWNHDIAVEPGSVYRYRLRVWVLNPLFQRSQPPRDQQEEHYHRLALASEAGPWTEPIQIEPSHHYFIVNGNRQQQSASVEVYTIFNGRRQVSTFDVRPGDPIGDVVHFSTGLAEVPVDMRVGTVLVDLDFDYPVSGAGATGRSTRAIIYDQALDQLQERIVQMDREDYHRAQLQNEVRSNRMAGR